MNYAIRILLPALLTLSFACGGTSTEASLDIGAGAETLGDVAVEDDGDITKDGEPAIDIASDETQLAEIGPDLCQPACAGVECGGDGCGGSCGDCGEALCFENACVECVSDDDCEPDHGCEENDCVPSGCPAIPCDEPLLCFAATGECVACIVTDDCPPFHQCLDLTCEPPPPCGSSKDCPDDTVCDKDKGYCLECVADEDCPEGHRCIETQICEEILYCVSDKECKAYDKVCDPAIGECVDCLTDFDCADALHCQDYLCLADLCDQAGQWPACSDGDVVSCSENGSSLNVTVPCPEQTFCAEAACLPWVCEPNSVGCAESLAFECNEDGSGYAAETDCVDEEEACSGGECKPVVCDPGQPVCLDPLTLIICSETGTDFITEPCGDGFFCDDASAACVGWICIPETKACDGETALLCDEFGTGWGNPVECDAEGLFCEAGECVECDPACGDRDCGPDACGGSCGTCGDPDSCLVGYCVDQTCPTPCNGKTPEAFLCGLDVCYPDLVSLAEVIAPLNDPLDQMFNVQAKYGADGNDIVPSNAPTLAIMATGKIANTQHNDQMAPNQCGADPIKEGQNCDVVTGNLKLIAPPGATGFSIDFVFLTMEVALQEPYDDRFYLLLNAPATTNGETWVINFMECLPDVTPDFAVEGKNYCYIRALSGFAVSPSPLNLTGTGFNGSTTWLRTAWQIQPGEEFTLTFRIADLKDAKYDSAAAIDNFQWLFADVTPKTEPLP